MSLLEQKWHDLEEDIVEIIELTKNPRSIDMLYETAIDIPDYDAARALAIKCISALRAINTKEAIEKLDLLKQMDDPIVNEAAFFALSNVKQK